MGLFDDDDGSLGGGIFGEMSVDLKRIEKIEEAVNGLNAQLHEMSEQLRSERINRAVIERLRLREGEQIVQLKKNSRPILKEYAVTRSAEASGVVPPYVHVSQDGPLEIVDIMCSREDVSVELVDQGSQRIVAVLTGPWLRRRDVALAELVKIAADAITEGKHAASIIAEALEAAGGLVQPQWIHAAGSFSIRIKPTARAAEDDPNITAWVRAVQWVNL